VHGLWHRAQGRERVRVTEKRALSPSRPTERRRHRLWDRPPKLITGYMRRRYAVKRGEEMGRARGMTCANGHDLTVKNGIVRCPTCNKEVKK